MSKNPNNITTEDLLAALENPESEVAETLHKVYEYHNDVPNFLNHFGIAHGTNKIPRRNLFSLYINYSINHVDSNNFFKSINRFLEKSGTFYLTNKTRSEITSLLHTDKTVRNRYVSSSLTTREHFEAFMKGANVREGNKWVDTAFLLWVYKKWCKDTKTIVRFKPQNFSKIAALFLPRKHTKKIFMMFRIDDSIMDNLTEADIAKYKEERSKGLNDYRKRKEERQKEKSQVSSVDSRVESEN